MVDVRHEAAHNELPSLALLRLAAKQALTWLTEYYWERQSQSLQDAESRVASLISVSPHIPFWILFCKVWLFRILAHSCIVSICYFADQAMLSERFKSRQPLT